MATVTSSVLKIRRAERKKIRARIALFGPSGAGKTFTSLRCAHALLETTESRGREGNRILLISSESGATEKYLGLAPDGWPWDFDIIDLPDFSPATYTDAFLLAAQEKYDVLIVDSWSHAWEGIGGVLDMVDNTNDKNRFTAWKLPSQLHQRMVLAALHSPAHLICTMRSKMEYVQEEVNGRKTVRKVGMAPIQRPGMEYEFDITFDLDLDHIISVGKTRCPEMDGQKTVKPTVNFFMPLARWLNVGSSVPPDYYAATEADLAKLEKVLRQSGPALSAAELAERAAAAQFGVAGDAGAAKAGGDGATAASSASAAVAAVGPATAAVDLNPAAGNGNGQPLATERQIEYIRANLKQAFASPKDFGALMASKNAKTLAELSKDDASDVIGIINENLRAKGLLPPKPADHPVNVGGQHAKSEANGEQATNGTGSPAAGSSEPPFDGGTVPAEKPAAKRGRKSKAEKEAEAAAAGSVAAGPAPTAEGSAAENKFEQWSNPAYKPLREWAARFTAERDALLAENAGMATKAQRKALQGICERLGKSSEQVSELMASRGVASGRSLTVDAINDLYCELLAEELGLSQGSAPKN